VSRPQLTRPRSAERLDSRPLSTIILLRCCFFMSPPATYALALSSVGWRTYFAGTLLGLIPPLSLMVLFSERVMAAMGVPLPAASDEAVSEAVAALAGAAAGEGWRGWFSALGGDWLRGAASTVVT